MNVRPFILAVVSVMCVVAPAFGDTRPTTLQWDASPEGTVAGYIVYVSHTSGSYDEAYDVSQQTSFVYTKAVPGRPYFFSVAAYTLGSQVGPRSEEVLFFAGTATTLPLRSAGPESADDAPRAAAAGAGGASESRVRCLESADCYQVDALAAVTGRASGLTRTADGRVLFIEDGKHVRVIEGDVLRSAPALSADPSARLAGLVLDPGFADTRFVYVGVVGESSEDGRQLDIVRYREVANALGEGAVIVAGLPLPPTGDASLAVDAARRLYVAMPSASGGGSRTARYAGLVLRFESDGTAVEGDGADAPVFAPGYAQPTSLAWTGAGNELWLAGTDADEVGALVRVSLNRASGGSTVVAERVAVPAGSAVVSLTVPTTSGRASSADTRPTFVLVDEVGGVFRISAAHGGMAATPWIAPNELGGLVVSAVGGVSDDEVYLAVASGSEPAPLSSRVIRLRRQ